MIVYKYSGIITLTKVSTPILARNRPTLENIGALIYIGIMSFKSRSFLSKKGIVNRAYSDQQ